MSVWTTQLTTRANMKTLSSSQRTVLFSPVFPSVVMLKVRCYQFSRAVRIIDSVNHQGVYRVREVK